MTEEDARRGGGEGENEEKERTTGIESTFVNSVKDIHSLRKQFYIKIIYLQYQYYRNLYEAHVLRHGEDRRGRERFTAVGGRVHSVQSESV